MRRFKIWALVLPVSILLLLVSLLAGCELGPTRYFLVEGDVKDSSGNGIPGVLITATRDAGTSTKFTTTDETGHYFIPNLHGTVTITPSKAGWNFSPEHRQFDKMTIHANFTGTKIPGYSVSGQILDYDGDPIPEVTLNTSTGQSTETDQAGKYAFYGLNGSVTITVTKVGWHFESEEVEVTGERDDLDFQGIRSILFIKATGRVRDQEEQPISDVEIRAASGPTAVTDEDGEYDLRIVLDHGGEPIPITAHKEGWIFAPISIPISTSTNEANFVGTRSDQAGSYAISGKIVNDAGLGIPGVNVGSSSGEETSTDEDGRYFFEGLIGTVTITPQKEGWTFFPEERIVGEADDEVDFTGIGIVEPYDVYGMVVGVQDAGTTQERGIKGVQVRTSTGLNTETDELGKYSFTDLRGLVTITPEKEGWSFEPETREVTGWDNGVDFWGTKLDEEDNYGISGRIAEVTGAPIPGVIVESSSGEETSTDDDGRYSLEGLTGMVTITPQKEGWTFRPEERTVEEADDEVDFTGAKTGEPYDIYGMVVGVQEAGAQERGIKGVLVKTSTGLSTETDELGKYSFTDLKGLVTITPEKEGWSFEPEMREVTGWDNGVDFWGTKLDEEDNYGISGRIAEVTGAPIPGVIVESSSGEETITDDDGQYQLDGLSGSVTIVPSREGWQFEPEAKTVDKAAEGVSFTGTALGPAM